MAISSYGKNRIIQKFIIRLKFIYPCTCYRNHTLLIFNGQLFVIFNTFSYHQINHVLCTYECLINQVLLDMYSTNILKQTLH